MNTPKSINERIKALPTKISKQDVCLIFGVSRMRQLRDIFCDETITKIGLTRIQFARRQQFKVKETIIIKKILLELLGEEQLQQPQKSTDG